MHISVSRNILITHPYAMKSLQKCICFKSDKQLCFDGSMQHLSDMIILNLPN